MTGKAPQAQNRRAGKDIVGYVDAGSFRAGDAERVKIQAYAF